MGKREEGKDTPMFWLLFATSERDLRDLIKPYKVNNFDGFDYIFEKFNAIGRPYQFELKRIIK